ncbi:uncharacterized protein EURHEDRAFT_407752 [Aspergillus ruber CBS 135680]|uniref:Helix-turn-helix domain-containing protein n=1 Tax=Aspergillus ruber (strain CBS 135680) TaxID=1388766 RepID=A0A017ST24_ASPRC|nr:uncharacterized protein EURHEDRAFT_407752 [Aspergillus ruber CBS 135680]EYE99754.1 hypothetical protein EURHEDRAFT_407752 [Aspergillus ruber CBS 135680]
MGSASSKPARSAANAVSKRQYPKQPTAPPTAAPSAAAKAAQPQPRAQAPSQLQREPKPNQGPTYHPKERASGVKSSAIDIDGRDPDFAASLRHIGPVNPAPTFSPSSTFQPQPRTQPAQTIFPQAFSNPSLLVFSAREKITKAAEKEAEQIGKPSFAGRQFLDGLTIRQVISMRDRQGLSAEEIEGTLRLGKGVVERLGRRGIVGEIQ